MQTLLLVQFARCHVRNGYIFKMVAGSFHVNSTNFWMFFHWPPRIVLKFGTVVELDKKIVWIFFFLVGRSFRDMTLRKLEKHVFWALVLSLSDHNCGSTKHRKLVDGLFGR